MMKNDANSCTQPNKALTIVKLLKTLLCFFIPLIGFTSNSYAGTNDSCNLSHQEDMIDIVLHANNTASIKGCVVFGKNKTHAKFRVVDTNGNSLKHQKFSVNFLTPTQTPNNDCDKVVEWAGRKKNPYKGKANIPIKFPKGPTTMKYCVVYEVVMLNVTVDPRMIIIR